MKSREWFPITNRHSVTYVLRVLLLAVLLGISALVQVKADIYKCQLNGNTVFSDQPCSSQAEKIDLKIRQPQQQDIENQQQLTARFEEDSRVNQIHSLHSENKQLEQQINALEVAQQHEFQALAEKTYRTEDGKIVSTEHGLFDKMNVVAKNYQNRIAELEKKIKTNEQALSVLHQHDPKNSLD